MAGQNLYKLIETKSFRGRSPQIPCVFISHRQADKNAAKALADYLLSIDIDIYFDEYDGLLSVAATSGNTEKVVMYIENGLTYSTHLLGVISTSTKGSWWVPFEIGHARRRTIPVSYLLIDNVDFLPEYLRIASRLKDEYELAEWIRKDLGRQVFVEIKSESSFNIPGLVKFRYPEPSFAEES